MRPSVPEQGGGGGESDRHVRRRSRRGLGEAGFGRRIGRGEAAGGAGGLPQHLLDEDGHIMRPHIFRGPAAAAAAGGPLVAERPRLAVKGAAHFSRQAAGREQQRSTMDLDEDGNALVRRRDREGVDASAPAAVDPVRPRHGAVLLHFGKQRGRGEAAGGATGTGSSPELDEDGHIVRPAVPARPSLSLQQAGGRELPVPVAPGTGSWSAAARAEGAEGGGGGVLGLDEDGNVIRKAAVRTPQVIPPRPGDRRPGAGVRQFGASTDPKDPSGHSRPPPGHRGAEGELDEDGQVLRPR